MKWIIKPITRTLRVLTDKLTSTFIFGSYITALGVSFFSLRFSLGFVSGQSTKVLSNLIKLNHENVITYNN